MAAPVIVVVGPTGAGKSRLAIEIAKAAGGEVLSADSQQVYRGMDIGTGKVTAEEMDGVPHHLLDIADPDDEMTAARFLEAADAVLANAETREVPIVACGGTMLYVRVLLRGIFEGPPADPAIRERLETEAQSLEGGSRELWERLKTVDPESCERIDPADLRRIVRALEVHELTGETMSSHQRRHDFRSVPLRFPAMLIGVAPERETLYGRINQRVDAMMAAGWEDEVKTLRDRGYGPELRSQQAIGYSELHAYLASQRDLDDAVRLTKRNSRRYARRQLSWYRRDPSISWYEDAAAVDLDSAKRYLR